MQWDFWKKTEKLFVECIKLPESDRAAYLNRACCGDQALRQSVEELLDGDRREDSAGRIVGDASTELLRAKQDPWLGKRIGAYTITSRIAEGGMGVVYLASRSDRQFEHQAAIKLLLTSVVTKGLHHRFLAERQILASLSHPNIARLLDGGETVDGVPYLMMEYIDGIPITEYCDRHELGIGQRIRLFIQACNAVQFAHSNLVIHRDIKPSNVLVTGKGITKLLDFGIAKLLDQSELPVAGSNTAEGAQLLSPHHASPEQVRGENVTAASDVYSLGLLLYELLCGHSPYQIEDTTRSIDLARIITMDIPPAPSRQLAALENAAQLAGQRDSTTRELEKTLSGDLDTIVLKTLRKEAQQRYVSSQELINDLERYIGNQPIQARPPTFTYVASRFWKRHKVAAVGFLATLLAVIAGTTVATIGFMQARESEREAIIQARSAESISEFLASLFLEANPNQSAGNERTVRELLDIGTQRVNTELNDTPLVQSRMLETLSGVYKSLAFYPQAQRQLRQALDLQETYASEDFVSRARMSADLADLYRLSSDFDKASRLIGDALEMYARNGAVPDSGLADAMNALSLVYEEIAEFEKAGRMMHDTLVLRQQLFDPPHPDIALSLHNLAWHYNRRNDLERAEVYARQAVDMRVAVFGEIHPRVAASVGMLSRIQLAQGRWEDSEREALRAVEIASEIFDDGHPDLTFPLFELAAVKYARGDLVRANELYGQVVEWERTSLGPDSYDLGMSAKAYAETLVDLARYKEAELLLSEADTIFAPLSAAANRARFHTATLMGKVMMRTGRLAAADEWLGTPPDPEAIGPRLLTDRGLARTELLLLRNQLETVATRLERMLQTLQSAQLSSRPGLAEVQQMTARLLVASGKEAEAIGWLNMALDEFGLHWDDGYWPAALARAELGMVYISLGDTEAARSHLDSAVPTLKQVLGSTHPAVRRYTEQIEFTQTENE